MSMIEDIVQAIGEDAAVMLIGRFGGLRIYLPQTADTGHPIAEAIGLDKMVALIARFGNGDITVPLATRHVTVRVHAEIREKHAAGASANQLAAEYRYTWRHIYRIAAGTALKNENLELPL